MTASGRDASNPDSRDTDLCVHVYMSAERQPFSHDDLRHLLTRARAHNTAAGITGLLLYHRGGFLQALEGPREAVVAVVERIRRDPRHHRVITVLDAPRTARYFPYWSMAFVDTTDEDVPEGFSRFLMDAEARRQLRHHPDRVHQLLRCYAEQELASTSPPRS